MMSFPTRAERALAEFRSATKTISITTIAKAVGARRESLAIGGIRWTFDDGSHLCVRGRGASHKAWTEGASKKEKEMARL